VPATIASIWWETVRGSMTQASYSKSDGALAME
jgi:hypothetical protein